MPAAPPPTQEALDVLVTRRCDFENRRNGLVYRGPITSATVDDEGIVTIIRAKTASKPVTGVSRWVQVSGEDTVVLPPRALCAEQVQGRFRWIVDGCLALVNVDRLDWSTVVPLRASSSSGQPVAASA